MFNKDCFLDHVAIAVKNLDVSTKVYEDLGLKFNPEREVVESQGVKTAFAHVDEHAHIELLEPLNENSPIHKYIEKMAKEFITYVLKFPTLIKLVKN